MREAEEAEALGLEFTPSLTAPFRWQDWAAPKSPRRQDTSAAASVWKFVHEELLPKPKGLKDGEKGNDGAQFFTPREVIRVMVRIVDPQIGKTVFDPGRGTGGFLAQSFEHMKAQAGDNITPVQLETLRRSTFYGREKDKAVFPIALANLVLHGIDEPHLWHGNALSGQEVYMASCSAPRRRSSTMC